jgi:hypothetical protein
VKIEEAGGIEAIVGGMGRHGGDARLQEEGFGALGNWSWSPLINHHLHRRHESTFADPAGCSANGALHATCKD